MTRPASLPPRTTLSAFGAAFRGLYHVLRSEPHAKFHAIATLAVLSLAFYLRFARWEWIALLLLVGSVWVAEVMNSAVEKLADIVQPEVDCRIGLAKDICAGAVLVASGIAIVGGVLLFLPHLWLGINAH